MQINPSSSSYSQVVAARFDVCSYFEEFLNSLDNLPAEIQHLFAEFRDKENAFAEANSIIAQKQKLLRKQIRAQASTASQELKLQEAIKTHYCQAIRLSEEKLALSQKIVDLLDRHIKRMDLDISKVKEDWPTIIQSSLTNYQISDVSDLSFSLQEPFSIQNLPQYLSSPSSSTPSIITPHSNVGPLNTENLDDNVKVTRKHRRPPSIDSSSISSSNYLSVPSPSSSNVQSTFSPSSSSRVRKKKLSSRDKETKEPLSIVIKEEKPVTTGISVDATTKPTTTEEDEEASDDTPYCYCRQPSYGQMIGCDNSGCKIEWFHYECVGLTEPPPESWFCKDCRIKLG